MVKHHIRLQTPEGRFARQEQHRLVRLAQKKRADGKIAGHRPTPQCSLRPADIPWHRFAQIGRTSVIPPAVDLAAKVRL